jgi:uncharacterized protein YdaU (DUF1376 family)
MPKRIIFPCNIGDYRRDTDHLTTFEHGAYWLLIQHYWTHGGLPDDDNVIRRIAGIPPGKIWQQTLPILRTLFQKPGWKHKRIDKDLAESGLFSDKMRALAKRRWDRNPVDKSRTIALVRSGRKPLKSLKPVMRHAMPSIKEDKSSLADTIGRGVENGFASKQEKQARQKWEADLIRDLGADDFAANVAVRLLAHPEICDRATAAEIRTPGTGATVAMVGLSRAVPT